jgi:acetolactate synthase-1/3 small subunit
VRHTLGVLVENQPGVLSRVAGLFSGRGFNIESLTVAETLDPQISHITLVTTGDEMIMEQIVKQLNKLINVIKVIDFREVKFVDREMVLIKVKAEANTRSEALRIVDIFRGKVVDVSPNFFTIEVTGDEGKIQAILDLLNQQGIVEVVRTGKVAIARSRKNSTKK